MKKIIRCNAFKTLIVSTVLSLIFSLASVIFLRNFYRLLTFDEQFYGIFEQLSFDSTKILPPFLILFILIFPLCLGLKRLMQKGILGKSLSVLLGVIAFVLITVISVFLAKVNGIMFLDVVRTLVPLLTSGVL